VRANNWALTSDTDGITIRRPGQARDEQKWGRPVSIDAIAYVKLRDLGEIETPVLRLLLLAIAENQYNDTRICRLTQAQFARELRIGERTVRRHLATLEEHRVIVRAPKRNDDGHVEYDRIRITGFTAWYRTKALPAKLAGRRKTAGNAGTPTGQIGHQDKGGLPAKNEEPTGQQVAGTVRTDSLPDSNNPPIPPKAGGTGVELISDLKADCVAALVVDRLLAPVLGQRRVSGLGDDPLGTLRGLRHAARHLGADALDRAARDVLDSARAKVSAAAIREAIATAKTAGARIVIVRGSAEWVAWMRHWETTDRPKWQLHTRLDRTQVPSRFPAAKPGLAHPEQSDAEQEASHA